MNKKGQVTQVLSFMVVVFVVAITIIFAKFIMVQIGDAFQEGGVTTATSLEVQSTIESNYLSMDWGLVILSIGLIVGLLITSFMIPTHPIFMVVNFIGIFILVFLGMVLTNVYGELFAGADAVSSGLADTADEFKFTNQIINFLPFIGAIVIFITSIVMFSRGSGGGGY